MTRQVFIYDPITKQMVPKERMIRDVVRGPLVMGDLPDFVSPVDGSVVKGRAGMREHFRRYGVTNIADYKEYWAKKAEARARYFTEGPSNAKEAVIRAYDELSRRK